VIKNRSAILECQTQKTARYENRAVKFQQAEYIVTASWEQAIE